MPRICWPLQNDYPIVEITLIRLFSGDTAERTLIADTGAGHRRAPFELILSDADCQQYLSAMRGQVRLSGAITGRFPLYLMWAAIPTLHFARFVYAVGVPATALPQGFEGIAGFRFLNSFHYGNFGDPDRFGLETF